MMDFSGKDVVVTGGTGALGTAVIAGLLAAGARCTVPYVHTRKKLVDDAVPREPVSAEKFPANRENNREFSQRCELSPGNMCEFPR